VASAPTRPQAISEGSFHGTEAEKKSADGRRSRALSEEVAVWASRDSMEGISAPLLVPYTFAYRGYRLQIKTESNGAGDRYVIDHPSERDEKNNRPKRIRRNSQEDIENEARKIIDQELAKSGQPIGEDNHSPSEGPVEAQPPASLESLKDELELWRKQLPPELSLLDAIKRGLDLLVKTISESNSPPQVKRAELLVAGNSTKDKTVIIPAPTDAPAIAPAVAVVQPAEPGPESPSVEHDEVRAPIAPDRINEASPRRRRKPRESKILWPPNHEFLELLWTKPATLIGTQFHCGPVAVLKRADLLGLAKPDRWYWSRKKFGDPVEIPAHIRTQIEQFRNEAAAAVARTTPLAEPGGATTNK
jgi:hypothetical protein